MKKIYISGQITGLTPEVFNNNFIQAKDDVYYTFKLVKNIEHKTISPLDLNPFLGIKSWLCYMIIDIHHLRKCTHIAMQKNWIHSRGAHIEHYLAKFIFKLEVIYL